MHNVKKITNKTNKPTTIPRIRKKNNGRRKKNKNKNARAEEKGKKFLPLADVRRRGREEEGGGGEGRLRCCTRKKKGREVRGEAEKSENKKAEWGKTMLLKKTLRNFVSQVTYL